MKVKVEKNRNYTVMSNFHLRDKRLSFKAKGLLSFMLSLPEDWDYTVKGLATQAKDGVDGITATLKELEGFGYVCRGRIRNEKGQLMEAEYIIYEEPQETQENSQINGTEPIRENPELDETRQIGGTEPIRDFPRLENPAQINTNIINTYLNNYNNILSNQSNIDNHNKATAEAGADRIDKIGEDFCAYLAIIKDNIDYDGVLRSRCDDSDMEIVDGIVSIMADTVTSQEKYIRIGKRDIPADVVKGQLLKLDYEHITYVLDCLKKSTTEIKSPKNYLLTAVYQAPNTMGAYIQSKWQSDNYGSKGV